MECQVCGNEIEEEYVSGQGFWACSTECIQNLESNKEKSNEGDA